MRQGLQWIPAVALAMAGNAAAKALRSMNEKPARAPMLREP